MTIGDMLLEEWAGNVNKSGEVFKAIFANDDKTGAVEKCFNQVNDFCKSYTSTPSVYKQESDMLDKTVSFFSYLERIYNENDDSLKRRFKAIFYRSGDTPWGTPYDVKNVFKEYFNANEIYLLENTNNADDTSLQKIVDGDFENGEAWTFTNCKKSVDAGFSKSEGVEFSKNTNSQNVLQTITVNNNHVYFLHWFMNGSLSVKIKNNTTGLYWDNSKKTWSSTENYTTFETEEWDNKSIFFSLKNIASGNSEIEISFCNVSEKQCYLDYVLCFEKQLYPSFTLVVHYTGDVATNALALAEGTKDSLDENIPENIKVKKENWGYYNQAFVTGPQSEYAEDIYNELLDYVRSVGVKAYIEFVTKDYIES